MKRNYWIVMGILVICAACALPALAAGKGGGGSADAGSYGGGVGMSPDAAPMAGNTYAGEGGGLGEGGLGSRLLTRERIQDRSRLMESEQLQTRSQTRDPLQEGVETEDPAVEE